ALAMRSHTRSAGAARSLRVITSRSLTRPSCPIGVPPTNRDRAPRSAIWGCVNNTATRGAGHMSAQPSNDEDRVLLTTGASSGIGAASAREAAAAGWRVVLAARSQDRLAALAEELGGPERALAVACDVTSWEDQQQMVARTLEAFGRLDAAFANAGFGAQRG